MDGKVYKKVEIQDIGGRLSIIVGKIGLVPAHVIHSATRRKNWLRGRCFALYLISLVSPYNKSARNYNKVAS